MATYKENDQSLSISKLDVDQYNAAAEKFNRLDLELFRKLKNDIENVNDRIDSLNLNIERLNTSVTNTNAIGECCRFYYNFISELDSNEAATKRTYTHAYKNLLGIWSGDKNVDVNVKGLGFLAQVAKMKKAMIDLIDNSKYRTHSVVWKPTVDYYGDSYKGNLSLSVAYAAGAYRFSIVASEDFITYKDFTYFDMTLKAGEHKKNDVLIEKQNGSSSYLLYKTASYFVESLEELKEWIDSGHHNLNEETINAAYGKLSIVSNFEVFLYKSLGAPDKPENIGLGD